MHLFSKHVFSSDYVFCTESKRYNPPLEEPVIFYIPWKLNSNTLNFLIVFAKESFPLGLKIHELSWFYPPLNHWEAISPLSIGKHGIFFITVK